MRGMETNLNQVREAIQLSAATKRDEIVPIRSLQMDNEGRMKIYGRPYELDHFALGQLGSRFGVPAEYLRKCPPDLQQKNINFWIDRFLDDEAAKENPKDKNVFVRLKDEKVRAILSDRYAVLDNSMVIDALPKALNQSYEIEHFHHIDDSDLRLRVIFPDLKKKIGETAIGKDDILQVGIQVRNSERGTGSVSVDSVVYRLVCTNGMMGIRADAIYSKRHMFVDANALNDELNDAIKRLLNVGQQTIHTFAQAKEQKLDTPIEILNKLAKDQKYTKAQNEALIAAYSIEPEATTYGIINAFTRAAQQFGIDKRIEMEQFAGSLLRANLAA